MTFSLISVPSCLRESQFISLKAERTDERASRTVSSIGWVARGFASGQLDFPQRPGKNSHGFAQPTRVDSVSIGQTSERRSQHTALPVAHFFLEP